MRVVEMGGFITDGLKAVYEGGNPPLFRGRRQKSCSAGGCAGSGGGCL